MFCKTIIEKRNESSKEQVNCVDRMKEINLKENSVENNNSSFQEVHNEGEKGVIILDTESTTISKIEKGEANIYKTRREAANAIYLI